LTPISHRAGILYAILAYSAWGLFPLYWKLFGKISAIEILSHRMLWSGILLLLFLAARRQLWELRKILASPQWLSLLGTATILAGNWGLYIYAVNSDRIIETSLGYYINPLVSVLLGVVILHERLHWIQWLAVAIAAFGVTYSVFAIGQVPWIALALAISFAFYGLLRKIIPVQPLAGLTAETCLLAPVAIAYMGYLATQHTNHFGQNPSITLLFIGCGIVTSLPLFCFNTAAQRLQLSTLGLFQYIAPSFQLLCAIWIYKEPFTLNHAITFGCIWTALALYSGKALLTHRF
jgi:chloramphenicol-sensitive protein RarD